MTEKGFRIVSDINREGWEKSDFPILCETCMGDNPYVRMVKEDYGMECRICTRPFTIFRWKAGTKGRHKVTVACQTCSKMKNVCQTCLFDLEYGLPVAVRDKYLAEHERVNIPQSDVNRDYMLNSFENGKQALPYGKSSRHPVLEKLARMTPYYKRNEARICSFFVKGTCTRGDTCPYRHEVPQGGELANQNIKDRFHGMAADPLAKKILRQMESKETNHPPEDKSVTTVYVGGLQCAVADQDLRDAFYQYGEIASIRMAPKNHCAFITFVQRSSAESAMEALAGKLMIGGSSARLHWAKPKSKGDQAESDAVKALANEAPAYPSSLGGGVASASSSSGDVRRPYYPSMDPSSLGNAPLVGPTVVPDLSVRAAVETGEVPTFAPGGMAPAAAPVAPSAPGAPVAPAPKAGGLHQF